MLHHAQARDLEQVVERGVDLQILVVFKPDLLERAQLANKRRHAAEAAVLELKLAQRLHSLQLFRECLVVGRGAQILVSGNVELLYLRERAQLFRQRAKVAGGDGEFVSFFRFAIPAGIALIPE